MSVAIEIDSCEDVQIGQIQADGCDQALVVRDTTRLRVGSVQVRATEPGNTARSPAKRKNSKGALGSFLSGVAQNVIASAITGQMGSN